MNLTRFYPYELIFKNPSGTSRGILHTKKTYIIEHQIYDKKYISECPFFEGLSNENQKDVENNLNWLCENIHLSQEEISLKLNTCSCVKFGYEQLQFALKNQSNNIYFPSKFTDGKEGIKINGLIWMGTIDFMKSQIEEKLAQGFSCIKLKIGVNWEEEYELIKQLRIKFPKEILEIRVDANGAFSFEQAQKVLEQLHQLSIHSIEQPIKAQQVEKMSLLCKNPPTSIVLDEELIGITQIKDKKEILEFINPQYIILKPSLVGGISGSLEWIDLCSKLNINWWVTSALESNIGLNFIAQWTFTLNNSLPQGLGTGSLFNNNFPSQLKVIGEELNFLN